MVTMMYHMDIKFIVVLYIQSVDYLCIIVGVSKSEAKCLFKKLLTWAKKVH